MSIRLNEIQIAGAGAGKTYGLSKKLLEEHTIIEDNKVIYAVTFTNAAKKNIEERILEDLGYIPKNITITTIHGFLLNEIIYPFNKFIQGTHYNKAVSIKLADEPKYKRYKLKQLNDNNIIHNEQVFKKAKMILKKDKKNRKIQKKIDIVMQHIEDSIDSILIDEAQDMDKDAIEVFTILSELNMYIYMVGDPKQAIKYNGVFKGFCDEVKNGNHHKYTILDNINFTKRVPIKHLELSNMFCPLDERQTNENDFEGKSSYLFHSDSEFNNLFIRVIDENGLIYISKSNTIFATQKNRNNIMIPNSIQNKLKDIKLKNQLSFDVWIYAIIDGLQTLVEKGGIYHALELFQRNLNIELSKQEYAELKDIFKPETNIRYETYNVISIDRAKGLESELCVFIMDNSQFQYFMGYKKERNKEFNKLYVA